MTVSEGPKETVRLAVDPGRKVAIFFYGPGGGVSDVSRLQRGELQCTKSVENEMIDNGGKQRPRQRYEIGGGCYPVESRRRSRIKRSCMLSESREAELE